MSLSHSTEDEPDENSHRVVHLQRASDLILILDTPKGRGVYAQQAIKASTIIDVSPVLVLSAHENREHIEKTCLYHYTYNWPGVNDDSTLETRQAVVFGLGSMFNHSRDNQNVGWTRDIQWKTITYRALRDIPAGEELCISYGSRLTFEDADAAANDGAAARADDTESDGVKMLTQIEYE